MKHSLSRCQKLLHKPEFFYVYREGNRWNGKSLLFFYLKTSSSPTKLGITIAKKWGKAHLRNRFKRVVREGFRKLYRLFPEGLFLNVHPKSGYHTLTSRHVEFELKSFISVCGQAQSQSTSSRCHN